MRPQLVLAKFLKLRKDQAGSGDLGAFTVFPRKYCAIMVLVVDRASFEGG